LKGIEKLDKFIKKSDGTFTSLQVQEAGIHSEYLTKKVESGQIERVTQGVYVTPETMEDKMFILQCRKTKVIFSHETALYLHDLTDRDPLSYTVTVPSGYNTKTLVAEGVDVHTVKKELIDMGLSEATTIYGHKVKTYDVERTVCDIISDRNNQDIAIVTDMLKRYVRRKDKDLGKLMKYAEKLRVTKPLRTYLEVLL
jgi:predicted transcriptional regulator of viral defense system